MKSYISRESDIRLISADSVQANSSKPTIYISDFAGNRSFDDSPD